MNAVIRSADVSVKCASESRRYCFYTSHKNAAYAWLWDVEIGRYGSTRKENRIKL